MASSRPRTTRHSSPLLSPVLWPSFRTRLRSALPALAIAAVLTGTLLLAQPSAAGTAGGRGDPRPTAIVAIGDSVPAGEGAGDYDPDSNRLGDWCHRSPHAQINRVRLPGIEKAVNLACSGAMTVHMRLGGWKWFTEEPQVERLRTVARDHRVKVITVSAGINDVPFFGLIAHCIAAYAGVGPECRHLWNHVLPARLRAIQPKVTRVLTDIRTVMREAGYADGDYELYVQTYMSPVPARSRYGLLTRSLHGCPMRERDLTWGHDEAVPQLNAMVTAAARAVPGVRLLDYTSAFDGHEVCARGISHREEWSTGVYLDLSQIRQGGPGPNLIMQSLHPNALGHGQMARCLQQFYAMRRSESGINGHCAQDAAGNLQAKSGMRAPLSR